MPKINATVTRRSFLAASVASAVAASSAPAVTFVTTPEGGVQPQAAVDSSGVIHLIYLYGDPAAADIGYVRKAPDDTGFSSPIRVNSQRGNAVALGTVRGARLALGPEGTVHVAWNGSTKAIPKGPQGSAPMLYTRLARNGKSFEPERNLMQTASGLDGGGAIAADKAGNVYVVWHAMGQKDGVAIPGEDHRRVWMAHSTNGGKEFERERAVSPAETGACGCCGMGALADSDGNLYLMYRTARATIHRDMYLLVSRDQGRTFRATDLQPWEIGACPMSTVSMTQSGREVLLSWETNKQVYFAKLDPRTSSVTEPVAAPGTGKVRKHPAIVEAGDGRVLLCWTDGTGWKRGGSLEWQVFNEQLRPVGSSGGGAAVPVWGMPAVVSVRGRFLVIC